MNGTVLEIIMALREFYYRWEWKLKTTPQQLWPLVADTNRFDADTGLPTYDELGENSVAGLLNTRRRLQIHMYGIPLEWVEEPFEWVRPFRFGVTRNYQPGPLPLLQPLKQLRVQAHLNELPDGGTHLIYEVWATPRNILGVLAIPLQIGKLLAKRFDKIFREYDKMAIDGRTFLDSSTTPIRLPNGSHRRLMNLQKKLVAESRYPELVERLIDLIQFGDDLTLHQLRPYVLADHWGANRRHVLETMLLATRNGLLDVQWDLLCPMCRVAKGSASHLADVNQQVHCDTCNIDYTANFDRSVEVTFRPNPAVRSIADQLAICTNGPEATPHVALQQLLEVGKSRLVMPQLKMGRYRLRTALLPGGQFFKVAKDGEEETAVNANYSGWPTDEQYLTHSPMIQLKNETDEEQLFILERLSWSDDAVTAAEVTTLQQFRDLFSSEALRPGDQISVGSLTILFTDLVDSTRMYREIGDAPAFGVVMSHFDVLREVIREEDGAIVKTIGDAVMAVFKRPVSAVRAVHEAQRQLAELRSERPLRLKAAIHYGPSIAVTLNERLDYFGSTVNIASRLEKFSQGSDIVLSDIVYTDPEVSDYLSNPDAFYEATLFERQLKGYDDECFSLWRIGMQCEEETAVAV